MEIDGGKSPLESIKTVIERSDIPVDKAIEFLAFLEQNDIIKKNWSENVTIFASSICESIICAGNFIIYFYPDGIVGIPAGSQILHLGPEIERALKSENAKELSQEIHKQLEYKPFIQINITGLLMNLLTDESKGLLLEKTGLLATEEIEVLRALREGKVKNVSIQYHGAHVQNPQNMIIEYKRKGVVDKKKYQYITDALFSNKHATIEIKRNDGEILSYDTTIKKIVKKGNKKTE